ncbi:DNA polymerase sigma subunit [Apostasia shenzhenica]|uniref:DNA polymerase sigma subunit n=1 Tax=Apostasia shenzhenica TaxID=1088818 RepID=A0A2I0AYR7_9ASPA|nr:DNA polymerase sigma subunit [Apostasia shenzhenica]
MDSLSYRLVHSLTAHLALYHSSSSSPNPNSTLRASLLRWFSSLSPGHRQAALTVCDAPFVLVLLQMQSHLRRFGHSHFLLLPDLPSSSGSSSLPSLSFRTSRGLLSRLAASSSSAFLFNSSILLFSSSGACPVDALTVSESLVADVDRFVVVMDKLSGGRFLCEEMEVIGLTALWAELPWLKDMGYYSLEAFVANRLEVALRLAWFSSQGGKKPKEKRAKEKASQVAGKAANVFWRTKGRFDWWVGLDPGKRRAIISTFFGKAAKALANEIINNENASLRNDFGFLCIETSPSLRYGAISSWQRAKQAFLRKDVDFGLDFVTIASSNIPNRLAMFLNKLLVVHDISNMYLLWQPNKIEYDKLFFSSFSSVLTISHHIMRKLERTLIAVHADIINHELVEDSKLRIACRKGKGKSQSSKKSYTVPKAYMVISTSQESSKKLDFDTEPCSRERTSSPIAAENNEHGDSYVEDASVSVESNHPCKRKNRRKGTKNKSSKNVQKSESENKDTFSSVPATRELEESVSFDYTSNSRPESADVKTCANLEDTVEGHSFFSIGVCPDGEEGHPCSTDRERTVIKNASPCVRKSEDSPCNISPSTSYFVEQMDSLGGSKVVTSQKENFPAHAVEPDIVEHPSSCLPSDTASKSFVSQGYSRTVTGGQGSVIQNGHSDCFVYRGTNSIGGISYEWPSRSPLHFTSIPAATDRLHLDVGHGWPYHIHQSYMPSNSQVGISLNECGHSGILPSLTFPMSYDSPLVVKNRGRPSQSLTISYESAYSPSIPPPFYSGLAACAAHGVQVCMASGDTDGKHNGEFFDVHDMKNGPEYVEDTDSYWLSEEESEVHTKSGRDYNKFFGGGVMYWNPAEHVGTGFSRAPSHSSEDSSWAWHEAELNRTIDDMVGGKSGLSYSTNGISSPPTSSYCSPFDSLASGHQSIGHAVAGNGTSCNVANSPSLSDPSDESSSPNNSAVGIEGMKGDPHPYPMLRPIIIPGMSRKGSRSDFKLGRDHKSPSIATTRRDTPWIKRPPSPVVLCVPRVPRPPPPSPVGESRKRGFPIVRSGSSSPRHWGLKSWFHEENNTADTRLCLDGAEVVWPTWANKNIGVTTVSQSLQGSLLQDHLIAISQLTRDQEHPDVALPLQPPDLVNGPSKALLSTMQNLLHEEIDFFCKQVAAENLVRKSYINWAVKRVTRSLQVLWPRSRTNLFGSNATGLALPTSDVDLVVSLPPVRNLEPIKEAGILEGRNGIKETCLQHAARYLANQEWVRNDSLKTIENTAIPIIMLVADVAGDMTFSTGNTAALFVPETKSPKISVEHCCSSEINLCNLETELSPNSSAMKQSDAVCVKSIRVDISFKSASHTGLQTSELVRELTQQFPASVPLALVLKKFLADRSLDHSYSGGLSSYCLVLLITRFLQHEHHCGHSINQNLGSLLMDFLYFFGNVFDPRQMRVSIQGTGVYMKRERGLRSVLYLHMYHMIS